VVVTNPPYMGSSGMGSKLADYVKKNYPETKSDMFACFIEKGFSMAKRTGFISMITMESWMFLSSFEKMRQSIVTNKTIVNMVHMPYLGKGGTSLGINFGTAAVVFNNKKISNYAAQYDYVCYYETDDNGIPFEFPVINERYKTATTENFKKIPGAPIAYWVSERMLGAYKKGTLLGDCSDVKIGMGTGKNDLFVREWWEIKHCLIDFSLKSINDIESSNGQYFPYNKGGEFRLWYGNLQEVLWFDKDGRKLMDTMSGHRENGGHDFYCKAGLTWSFVSSSKFGIRFMPSGCFFDVAGSTLFSKVDNFYTLGFLASTVCFSILSILNPTLNYQAGNIKSLPLISNNIEQVDALVQNNIDTSKTDWDSFETSWDFEKHPLIRESTVQRAFAAWEQECNDRFDTLKANEEELNRIFIDIYGLQDELTPEVADKDVTVRLADKTGDIKSLISYAVGCMFGRYSLDAAGLAYAGGDWDAGKYTSFL
ncbi:MAG: BREX-1 system adenine-specific DNA-methyltransferase PglX, partial [Oscillospiraceae bacterium]